MKIPKIRKLPSGAYTCQIRIDGRSISITHDRREIVEAKAYAYKSGVIAVQTLDGGNLTLGEAVNHYIESRKNTLSPSTIRGYRIICNNRFPTLMRRKLAVLNGPMCQNACDEEAKIVSPKTLSNSWNLIRTVISEYSGQSIKVRLPQREKNERPFLSPKQISVFVDAINGIDIEIPALLALSSLRLSEILAVTFGAIDTENGLIRVSGAVVLGEDNVMTKKKTNKNASSTRSVPIFIPRLLDILTQEKALHSVNDPVTSMTRRQIYGRINTVCRQNDLPEVGVHGLRHSFASLAYSLNIPELTAMQIGGWSDFGTMRRIYTHIAESQKQKNVEQLSAFFKEKPSIC